MLIALASIILAIVFSFRAYYAAEESKLPPQTVESLRIASILIVSALSITILGVIISIFMYGTASSRSAKNIMGTNILFNGLALIIGIIMIVALVYTWIAYTNVIKTSASVDALIAAIAMTVAIISPFMSRGGIASIPIVGENIFGSGWSITSPSETLASGDNLFIQKLQNKM
jgi:hypothetical protein